MSSLLKINICMDKQTLNLIKKYINFEYFNNTSIDSIPVWEIRDSISNNINLKTTDKEHITVNTILNHFLDDSDYSWNPKDLTIIGEAQIQALLRNNGYDLKCFGLDVFPTSIKELKANTEKYSKLMLPLIKFDLIKNTVKNKSKNFICWLANTRYFWFGILTLSSLIYSVLTVPDLLIYALVTAWFFCNINAILAHEYWTHDLVKPKNRLLGFIFDYIGYLAFALSRLEWRFAHRWHHKHWKTDKDEDYKFKNTPLWFYLMFDTSLEVFKGAKETDKPQGFWDEAEKCHLENISNLPPESRFLEKHWVKISILTHLVLISVIGYVNWTYFVLLQAWLFRCYILGFNEIMTHWPLELTREQEFNRPHLFALCCGTAYHKTHHFEPTTIVVGPGKLKYFNIQYWFIKLFLKPTNGTKFS